jgi:hypothetical protein
MKKLMLGLIAVLFIGIAATAQNAKPEWATIKTPALRCWECKKSVEEYFAKEIEQTEGGIIKLQINLLSGTCRVQYWPDRTNLDYIRTVFANAGYDADEVKAEEDSYKKLKPACKRAAEGGGPQKGKPCHIQPY